MKERRKEEGREEMEVFLSSNPSLLSQNPKPPTTIFPSLFCSSSAFLGDGRQRYTVGEDSGQVEEGDERHRQPPWRKQRAAAAAAAVEETDGGNSNRRGDGGGSYPGGTTVVAAAVKGGDREELQFGSGVADLRGPC